MFTIRFLIIVGLGAFMALFISFLTIGYDFRREGPLKNGLRKRLIHLMYKICSTIFLFICGISTSKKVHKYVDYSKYLGSWY